MGQTGSILKSPSGGYNEALTECRRKYDQLVIDVDDKGGIFYDPDFDVVRDKDNCLHGLVDPEGFTRFNPGDARRITDIYDGKAEFVVNTGTPHKVVQSWPLQNCWFIAALAAVVTGPPDKFQEWIREICVVQDAERGIYGFLFFRDVAWVYVIIDDRLFVERGNNKKPYFSTSGDANEVWVPLIEKAYAKLHGDYSALHLGSSCDAMVDLTGGAPFHLKTKDLSQEDSDALWERLRQGDSSVSGDRFFGCSSGTHAYTVLRAVEHRGEKFVVIRDPYASTSQRWVKIGGWTDDEWKVALTALGYKAENKGESLLKYQDFCNRFGALEETRLSRDWTMETLFLQLNGTTVPPLTLNKPTVLFTFSLKEKSMVTIVLAQLGNRHWKGVNGSGMVLRFTFKILDKDKKEVAMNKTHGTGHPVRGVSAEGVLEAEELYSVEAEVEIFENPTHVIPVAKSGKQKHHKLLMKQLSGHSKAQNFKPNTDADETVYMGLRIYGPDNMGATISPATE